jgi:hypothetical protein
MTLHALGTKLSSAREPKAFLANLQYLSKKEEEEWKLKQNTSLLVTGQRQQPKPRLIHPDRKTKKTKKPGTLPEAPRYARRATSSIAPKVRGNCGLGLGQLGVVRCTKHKLQRRTRRRRQGKSTFCSFHLLFVCCSSWLADNPTVTTRLLHVFCSLSLLSFLAATPPTLRIAL